MTIWTIGHSTRPIEDFVAILRAHEIECVVDVRRFPGSRRLPQFGSSALASELGTRDIAYCWIAALGGRRRAEADSPNDAWENAAFRAYADHMASDEFADALFELETIAGGVRTTVMCAEALWWRCHRRLIADALTSVGYDVRHIRDTGDPELHRLASPASLVDGVLSYESPDRQIELELLSS